MAGNTMDMNTSGLSEEYLAKRAALPVCVVCERPMRPVGEKAEDWPATVAYATTEQCKSCYNRKYTKALSAADVLKPVRQAKVRYRGMETTRPVRDLPRAEVASHWTAEERAAALQVCEMALHGTPTVLGEAREAGDIMEMLGLFDIEKSGGYGLSDGLKGEKFA